METTANIHKWNHQFLEIVKRQSLKKKIFSGNSYWSTCDNAIDVKFPFIRPASIIRSVSSHTAHRSTYKSFALNVNVGYAHNFHLFFFTFYRVGLICLSFIYGVRGTHYVCDRISKWQPETRKTNLYYIRQMKTHRARLHCHRINGRIKIMNVFGFFAVALLLSCHQVFTWHRRSSLVFMLLSLTFGLVTFLRPKTWKCASAFARAFAKVKLYRASHSIARARVCVWTQWAFIAFGNVLIGFASLLRSDFATDSWDKRRQMFQFLKSINQFRA